MVIHATTAAPRVREREFKSADQRKLYTTTAGTPTRTRNANETRIARIFVGVVAIINNDKNSRLQAGVLRNTLVRVSVWRNANVANDSFLTPRQLRGATHTLFFESPSRKKNDRLVARCN